MSTTFNLKYKYILENMVGEDRFNENLTLMDVVNSKTVIARTLTTPPGSPSTGAAYIPAATATGAWAGAENKIVYFYDKNWVITTPLSGRRVFDQTENEIIVFNGTSWARQNLVEFLSYPADIGDFKVYSGSPVFAPVTMTNFKTKAWEFPTGADTVISFSTGVTKHFNDSTNWRIRLNLYMPAAGTSKSFNFTIERSNEEAGQVIGADERLTNVPIGPITWSADDLLQYSAKLQYISETTGSQEIVPLKISRLGSSGVDDYGSSIYLIGVAFQEERETSYNARF